MASPRQNPFQMFWRIHFLYLMSSDIIITTSSVSKICFTTSLAGLRFGPWQKSVKLRSVDSGVMSDVSRYPTHLFSARQQPAREIYMYMHTRRAAMASSVRDHFIWLTRRPQEHGEEKTFILFYFKAGRLIAFNQSK